MLILIEPPAAEPVTLTEVKQHIHVDHSTEDARITDFIRTATQRLDGRDGLLGRCLVTQTWRLVLDRFSPEIAIPLPPCQSIESITYVDQAGDTQTLEPSDYQAIGLGGADPARVRLAGGMSWPATRSAPESVAITFIAGYPDTDDEPPTTTVPEPLRTAIKMHVGHLFEHRESAMVGAIAETPQGYDDLIGDYRMWRF